ncbi:MAG: hypothetical protein ABW188_06255 [Rhodococcus fascians]|uniref:hypothetical protein n=1 Tax=Nocardiaceae TaxID=85025 RepID=UPI000522F7F2|nr:MULTISPECIES: hypothetical protein [Rhodococcus]OZC49191.1 hypothetical protein CH267_23755 [Rhodococcus sp. 06-621-2]OZD12376.1 hypothetical protein CH253_27245 [Rhodococcus sp. 06-156-3C]OZD13835.1 hypothetical protein CH280_14830 [Rhodococcus sp. 06-156-4C]OZD21002.1 hypothetical protein CH248_12120 [Rhodococcus sp. 06-156-4a]OZD33733.1 hypothetical protein CH284_19185 [Rhodococcus sp. 06-156-3]
MLGIDTKILLLLAGLILLWALGLGVWKYRQMATSPTALAHPYVDIAHRAALMYSFATLILAALAEFSGFPTAVNLIAGLVVTVFFVAAIASYMVHGLLRDTDNQFENPVHGTHAFMWTLAVAEIGGTGVLVAGFVVGQFF